MDEGKPTKAKWWSRPRPGAPEGPGEPDAPAEGDFELARPAEASDGAAASAGAPERSGGEADGVNPGLAEGADPDDRDLGSGDGDSDGDYELSLPVSAAVPGPDAADTLGAAAPAGTPVPSDPSFPRTQTPPEVAPAPDAPEIRAESAPEVPPPVAADEPPKPLHDPDPYSTPPYGQPGPWAPAPPVQHPAATAAQGAAAQAAPPPVTPAPATPPATPPPLPTPGAPSLAAPPSTPAAPPSAGAPIPGAPVPLPGSGAPIPGTAAPLPGSGAPAPATAPGTPAPLPAVGAPAVGTPVPGAPVPSVPPGAAFAAPPVGTPTPPLASAHTPTPPLTSPGTPTPPVTPIATPVPDPTAPPAPPTDPWHRYDPWAPVPAGPLHQTGAAAPGEAERRRTVRRRLAGGALALALVSGVLGGIVGAHLERGGGLGGVKLPQASAEPAGRAADSVAGIAARALPSVVTLHVSGSEESGTGTGFVLDTRGHILTNNHVVEPAGSGGEITVVFNGGETAEAKVVGRDSGYDLAVVKVSGVGGLQPLPLGNSDNVQVGDPVVAIGAPFDLEGTVTSGIISAKERPITAGGGSGDGSDVSYVDALQTDAAINPGNSGGPLLDSRGRVIGINSAIRSAADGSAQDGGEAGSIGLGFAIPVNQGKRVAEELINTGRATHPVIGVTLDLDYTGDGARVSTKGGGGGSPVTPGGPGDLAGIEAGDVITEVDGTRIHSGDELIVKTRAHRPGDRLELTVERDGEERTLSLVLGSADGD
ncbi:trypsin-like peptidase domain-containing protein [Streptomyces sp. NPDC000345]|uniref:S1C family serine protease n=1 Tax=Streptomyces sp. NPDC000345 TaxID=3364537 RepID=UPI00368D1911